MSLANFFGFQTVVSDVDLPLIFEFPLTEADFVKKDLQFIYSRILTDVLERTDGVPEKSLPLLFDNCVASESPDGLITMLSKAMENKSNLFLVYKPDLNIIRKATSEEESQIKDDYEKQGKSKLGVFVSFKNYTKTDNLKIYSSMEYSTIFALSKTMNLAKAIQIKLDSLRSSTSITDSSVVIKQAQNIAKALADGKDILIDVKDDIVTAKPDLTASEASMKFINEKRSFYLGLPAQWIVGISNNGLGDSGNADSKAIERGLKGYYFSIVKPVIETIFNIQTSFKSENVESMKAGLETVKVFELLGDEMIDAEEKRTIVRKQFGLANETKAKK